MGEKNCKKIPRKVSEAGKDLATSNNKKQKVRQERFYLTINNAIINTKRGLGLFLC
uniref:Uncharacterized protein n=1 Tax=Carnobacterium maltaromaticum TaxID=2751 RepID=A0A1Z5AX40_CARML|nr:hypothetical protein [Carnobacterium maltaromaticum]CRI06641.1 protein of unknown function [Carnobacterium maltaromaticum]